MSIEELFSDDKYERIVYFFKSLGLRDVRELENDHFQELLYIPGIDEELMEEAVSVYRESYSEEDDRATTVKDDNCYEVDYDLKKDTNGTSPVSIEDNFLSDNQEEESFEVSDVSMLPLSNRARNVLTRHGITTLEQLYSLNENDMMQMRNLGEKTKNELVTYISEHSMEISRPSAIKYRLEGVMLEYKPLNLQYLKALGLSQRQYQVLKQNGHETIGSLCDIDLTPIVYSCVKGLSVFLCKTPMENFIKAYNGLKPHYRKTIVERSSGSTLQQIGECINLTRERARQIIAKTVTKLLLYTDLVAVTLCAKYGGFITYEHLVQLDVEKAPVLALILRSSKRVVYFSYSNKYIDRKVIEGDFEEKLQEITEKLIGDGVNFYENLETIEEHLCFSSNGMLDFEDLMNYLTHKGYHFYGDFVTRGKQPYGEICYDAVYKYFDFDIKLDSDANNEDMILLRKIILKKYNGLILPDKNRALTAGMTRDFTKLILSGRGRYCPIEKVYYSEDVIDEIYNHIINSKQSSFYYHELYSLFRGKLLFETNIDNHHLLHGVLKCLFVEEFNFERDMLIKVGQQRENADQRILSFLQAYAEPCTLDVIKEAIPGINNTVVAFAAVRNKDIIMWEDNKYIHANNIKTTDEERIAIKSIIEEHTRDNRGYTSETLIFEAVNREQKDYLVRNNICSPQNLFYILLYLYKDDFRFKRPHIVSTDFPVQDLSIVNISKHFINFDESLNYEDFMGLWKSVKWPAGSLSIFSIIEKDYIRISENNYINKNKFHIDIKSFQALKVHLERLLGNTGYLPFNNIFNYDAFPQLPHNWNGFLLESLIEEFDLSVRLVHRQMKDRRYHRCIIVPESSSYTTFEELVVGILKENNIDSISESKLISFLQIRGLISNSLPQELYNSELIKYRNELFIIR